MSLIYSVLKPVLRITAEKRQTITREDFIRQAKKVQKRRYKLPDIPNMNRESADVVVSFIPNKTATIKKQLFTMPAAVISGISFRIQRASGTTSTRPDAICGFRCILFIQNMICTMVSDSAMSCTEKCLNIMPRNRSSGSDTQQVLFW